MSHQGLIWPVATAHFKVSYSHLLVQEYIDADNEKQRPIMIHRAVFGSIERFFGILVENFAGAFPLWLAPVQVKILA